MFSISLLVCILGLAVVDEFFPFFYVIYLVTLVFFTFLVTLVFFTFLNYVEFTHRQMNFYKLKKIH